jgi:hypothetical protein
MHRSIILSALLLALVGCEQDAPEQPRPPSVLEAFPELPMPPASTLESRSGSIDVLQLVFRSTASREEVVGGYRSAFGQPGWRIVSDTRNPDSSVVMLAEKNDRAVWVRVEEAEAGSRIMLTGGVPGRDSVYEAGRSAARDSTNTLVPRIVR